MPNVALCLHVHKPHLKKLDRNLELIVNSHQYPFALVQVVLQRCQGESLTINDTPLRSNLLQLSVEEYDYENVLSQFGIPHKDPFLSEISHGWDSAHYYEHHCVNHCTHLLYLDPNTYPYVVFSDVDCKIRRQPEEELWVNKAIDILEKHPEVFIVCPSDGGSEFIKQLEDGTRFTDTVSQQLFMGRTSELRNMNFTNLPWDGKFDAPYGPFQEFYGMFEGHLWRWMRSRGGLYRAVLPPAWRYWHEN